MSFWSDAPEEHQEIAETYYRNIRLTHPNTVTSKRMCPCLEFCSYCGWAATSVTYYDYNGPSI